MPEVLCSLDAHGLRAFVMPKVSCPVDAASTFVTLRSGDLSK